MNEIKKKKILLTGGGTGGSVSPLLAIVDTIKLKPDLFADQEINDISFLWVGTKNGPEQQMVEREGVEFKSIASGKLRRYFSLKNFADFFRIMAGFFQSIKIIYKAKPDLVMSAGGFVSVPVVWAAWFLSVPVITHQQDVRPGLANKLMAPFAGVVTVTFEKSLKDYGKKAVWIGNPVRSEFENIQVDTSTFKKDLGLSSDLPVVLVVGGGTGASEINTMVVEMSDLLKNYCQIILLSGKDKLSEVDKKKSKLNDNLHIYEFFDVNKMIKALNSADLVVSRNGLSILTELSNLGKPSILIPIPNSHQEDNAKLVGDKKAAIILDQKVLSAEILENSIKDLLADKDMQKLLSENMSKVIKRGANAEMIGVIKNIIK